jgi:hypothetical protein
MTRARSPRAVAARPGSFGRWLCSSIHDLGAIALAMALDGATPRRSAAVRRAAPTGGSECVLKDKPGLRARTRNVIVGQLATSAVELVAAAWAYPGSRRVRQRFARRCRSRPMIA